MRPLIEEDVVQRGTRPPTTSMQRKGGNGRLGRMARLVLRIDFNKTRALGPGKVRLLELVGETGSISGAGRAMGMSYRRAWLLVDSMNQTFRLPVVQTRGGGAGGGGADLTPFGAGLVESYRTMERDARTAVARHLAAFEDTLAPAPSDN